MPERLPENLPEPPAEVAAYYEAQVSPHRETLLEMRRRILRVLPTAQERIKYSMPTFVYDGQDVCGLMAHRNHVGYYPYSGSVLSQLPELTAKYGGTPGALHVPVDSPLPQSAIRALITTRLAQPR